VFWRARALWQRGRFLLARRIWKARAEEQVYRDNVHLLGQFVRLTFGQLSSAILATIALQVLELLLVPSVTSLSGGWPLPDLQVYTSWLLTLAQIGGVFLALYFTALTAAAAAIYSQVPEHIRNLLAEEPVGNVYIKLLTFTTFTPLCLVSLTSLGLLPLRTAVPALVFFAGVGIMAFAKLGHRAFDLFSVMRLSKSAFANFGRALGQARAGSFRWRDPSFQNHAHKQGASAMRDLVTFSEICSKADTLKGKPLLDLVVETVGVLKWYEGQKTSIPTNSLWYRQEFRQKEWYRTPDWALSPAQQMGMPLMPEQKANLWWVEDELEGICLNALRTHLADSRLDLAAQLLDASNPYLTTLATNGDNERACKFCGSLTSVCVAFQQRLSMVGGPPQDQLSRVATAERLAAFVTSTLVAFTNGLARRSAESSRQRFDKIRMRRGGSIYKRGFTIPELQELERAVERLSFERSVEGHEVTPNWYILSMLAHINVDTLTSGTTELIASAKSTFVQLRDLFQANSWALAAVLATELEFWSRLAKHNIEVIGQSYTDQGTARVLTDTNWPVLDEVALRNAASKARLEVIFRAAAALPRLFGIDRPDGIPDYRGQFSDTVAHTVFQAITENSSDILSSTFAPFFVSSLYLFEQLKPTEISNDVWAEQKFQVAAAPILDIADLSGYAKLASELFSNPLLWTPVEEAWNRFIGSSPTALKWLAAIIGYGEPRFALAHRSAIRSSWQMGVHALLAGIAQQGPSRFTRRGTLQVDHESPLVRVYAASSLADGLDIFVDVFLREKPGASELDWGRHSHSRIDIALKRASTQNSTGDVAPNENT
jgi:hypothetical protein